MAYEFHYTPTGTGVISGKEVLEQTEDAINDLGNTAISGVQEALDKAEQALTNSENAVDDAQTALNTANNAEGVAIQAQTDVGNLSGTVTNIGNRVTTAEGNITNLQGRMTTAEGNITNLQGRMTTAEGNIGNLQTAVSTAQATANSAQQTATTARQQSYVFRYSSTALTPSSTNSNTLLDNTDNLKVGDKVIDSSGVLFSITAIDTANSTFTIGTALIDLAQDSDVVHKSGDESVIGSKRFGVVQNFTGYPSIRLYSTDDDVDVLPLYARQQDIRFTDKNNNIIAYFIFQHRNDANEPFRTCWRQNRLDGTSNYYSVNFNNLGEFYPENNNAIKLGTSLRHWAEVYATNYYYGLNNVEFSTKFVTTDTEQTISGTKTFTDDSMIKTSSPKVLLINTSQTGNTAPSSNTSSFLRFNGGTVNFGGVQCEFLTTGENRLTNYIKDITTAKLNSIQQRASSTTAMTIFNADLIAPAIDGVTGLGTSAKRWSDCQTKLINGLEPSSLSLPSNSYVDISAYFTNTSDGQTNSYTPTVNGYVYINAICKSLIIQIRDSNDNNIYSNMCVRPSDGTIYMTIPVCANNKVLTQWFTSSTVTVTTARFIPCQGNV